MTLDEINAVVSAYNKIQKNKLIARYDVARLIANFTSLAVTGGSIPEIEEVYPQLVEDNNEFSKAREIEQIKALEAQFRGVVCAVNASKRG